MNYEQLQIPARRDGWVRAFEPSMYPTMHLHSHRELEINLITRGSGVYFIQGGKYPIREGMLLWLFPDQPHLLVESSKDFTMWVGVFRPRLIRKVTGGADDSAVLRDRDPGTVFVQNVDGGDFRFLSGLCQRLADIPGDDVYFNGGLSFLLRSSWAAGKSVASMEPRGDVHQAVERVIHMMREGALDGSLTELARRAGISYSRLCSLFAEQLGQSPGDFRTKLRVRRFEYLVVNHPARTLLDLALEAGFGSYAQCHRTVRRLTGKSPAELRRQSSDRNR